MATPRKMPFNDTTNKASELLKSALKLSSIGNAKIQLTEASPQASGQRQEEFKLHIDDFEMFDLPADNNCYCCGDSRKSKFIHVNCPFAYSKVF